MKLVGGSSETPLTTGFYDDRLYTAPLFLPKGLGWDFWRISFWFTRFG